MFKEKMGEKNPLQLRRLNHISMQCRAVKESIDFYCNVLGFVLIQRPSSFNFDGAWLFNYGVGIHLIKAEDPNGMPKVVGQIDPKDRHISFQCESMEMVEKKLTDMKIEYLNSRVVEGGTVVDQLFFHDPDGSMIEVCNCENIPVVALDDRVDAIRGCSLVKGKMWSESDSTNLSSCAAPSKIHQALSTPCEMNWATISMHHDSVEEAKTERSEIVL